MFIYWVLQSTKGIHHDRAVLRLIDYPVGQVKIPIWIGQRHLKHRAVERLVMKDAERIILGNGRLVGHEDGRRGQGTGRVNAGVEGAIGHGVIEGNCGPCRAPERGPIYFGFLSSTSYK